MTLRIAEIFGPTIQGEGALIGEPTVFVRAGGCDYRCSWCDSLHAVDSAYRHTWTPMSDAEIWDEVLRLSGGQALTVSLSGGNPAIQDFGPLIARGRAAGYRFACETQGSVSRPWFGDLDTLVLSPKPPSSGESVDWAAFAACVKAGQTARQMVMKIVIFDEADYDWAKDAHARHPDLPLYLQPGNPDVDPESPVDPQDLADRLEWLTERAMTDGWFAPRILPQLHVLIWGNKRGV
ncbi:7-carboxy-7-deazaguanine synthase QueE [Phaeobacter gallaeciensis]|jgi:7-carboxy-7-deazaguanine synthase|uniref:7-carboxy-7-deazaguanine synthase QueE n=1 Tax=Phaeobacter gallaeciensis TaxID=60890 RepID=UPI00237F5E37|nr:7-carboxy-7-deazaguanine synthase QueE [Phaeobacter gallaeciensis]MDE4303324.1 7-carboxy-7-deazaguanine synthase QueE [Phaeobacter gallaeciensis]MDE4307715.1 7-carboxy-7-deazaguanine synthase QueE [Phaeobacter gallaeciensis]MDE4312173.1 7-carboxy-7-deazaguanine synthase QueE [Phaeobacter gallaeciensis]MDE4316322.1 7-carboxy-7-deazaguanine synthase QueE [Phaeobacter gallaeciensis]MDE4321107.1 7-carboxy-7-deazaguanine synthase QueE [Phaeobacter gallaeciensis]